MQPDPPDLTVSKYVAGLQGQPRYTFTSAEAAVATGRSPAALRSAFRRLQEKVRLATPRQGFHVIVPIEHQAVQAPPVTWFIHDLMAYLGQPYYVGLLSAAELHGAAHQRPLVFQVVTDRPVRAIRVGRERIVFVTKQAVASVPVMQMKTQTGYFRVSGPEATAFDLVKYLRSAGGLDNVATVLTELAPVMRARSLVELARPEERVAVQRLGYLLELVHHDALAAVLERELRQRPGAWVPLQPGASRAGASRNTRWSLLINTSVEADL